MKRQNDWYTGINYYDNYSETQITAERKTFAHEVEANFHEQVELLYVVSGSGCITVNGCDYSAKEGSFFCLYSHHFYKVHSIVQKLQVISVRFFIGLFMYMSWEKHPKNANAKLMYDTCPMVALAENRAQRVHALFEELLREQEEARFGSLNLIIYKTLELHAYFCRWAYEEIGLHSYKDSNVWSTIKRVLLAPGEKLTLKDMAAECLCTERTLNQSIKASCGYTFFQLQQMGKFLNACALLHFTDLTMNYISDLTGFSSVTAFYRVFTQLCKMTPREYQRQCIGTTPKPPEGSSLAMRFLQYMHLNFMHDLTLQQLCDAFYVKAATAQHVFKDVFAMSFKELLCEIRIGYACSFLKTGQCSAIDACAICGFDSYSTFARAFKSYMNQSPEEYKLM